MKATAVFKAASIVLLLGGCAGQQPSMAPMTFFITSTNPGKGADFGGLAGADRHCQALAEAAGTRGLAWRAYLSTQASGGTPAVNARDRIGSGPWQNAKGVIVAYNIGELHTVNNLTKQTALTEKGEVVNGRGDTPNNHDILTGSQKDGTAFAGSEDRTCGNWTKGGEGIAMTGHHDRTGLGAPADAMSWNSSHNTVGVASMCLQDRRRRPIYCFAAKQSE
jgi:hypothetical protein